MTGESAITAAGRACVAGLSALRRLPPGTTARLLSPALRIYPLLRPRHAARLKACFAAAPLRPPLSLRDYYSARLGLLLRGLACHGEPLPPAPPATEPCLRKWTQDLDVVVHGEGHYREALERGRPIALIGLHAGMVELLHRIPKAPEGRPFLILTAPAFSPPLTRYMARGREIDGKRILWTGRSGGKGHADGDGEVEGLGKGGGRDDGGYARTRGLELGLRSVIASNGVLALMADQHPGPAEACEYLMLWDRVRVPWPARLIRFLAAQGFQCLPVSTRMLKDGTGAGPEGSFATARFDFHPALACADAVGIRAFLEKAIAEAPEQWNWSYPKIGLPE